MRVLVSAAIKHGSTAEIAERIAETVRTALPDGAVVGVRPPAEIADVASYDAAVLGSAVYMGHWMEDAVRAAARIATHPPRSVWLFSSGPIGDPPRPDEDPVDVRAIVTSTRARGHRVFAGRLDRHRLGFVGEGHGARAARGRRRLPRLGRHRGLPDMTRLLERACSSPPAIPSSESRQS